jgi:hypothetical protein
MQELETLKLPGALPSANAMKSWGHSSHSYEPEVWEFEYKVRRFLGRVSDEAVRARYDAIVRNMQAIVEEDRNVIPINSFLSSWYWYRKEHQTRYEFQLRALSLERPLPVLNASPRDTGPARPRGPNAADVLFRYGMLGHLEDLLGRGSLRIKAAREYALMELDPARKDDEVSKHSFSPGDYTRVTREDGRPIKVIGDVKHSVTGADYFAYCVSGDWDAGLFDDFGVDCCAVIHNPDEFARRMEIAAKQQLPGWYFHHNPVHYFDPYEPGVNEHIDNAMAKDFRFAYQKEYRFLLASLQGHRAEGIKALELGPLGDIVTLHPRHC